MTLCFNISWFPPCVKQHEDGSTFFVNNYSPDAQWVIDFGNLFSPLASKYAPERRIHVSSEPSKQIKKMSPPRCETSISAILQPLG